MEFEESLEEALKSNNPAEVLLLVTRGYYERGHGKDEILESLTQFMVRLREQGRENDEDLILDFYSYLIGYSALKPPF